MAPAEQGSMAGDKRLSQKDPGLWLLMPRVLGWAWLFSPGGWGMGRHVICEAVCMVHTLEGALLSSWTMCRVLLFVTLWLPVVTCLRSQLSAYEVK